VLFPDYPPAFWICAVFAVVLFGISKAGFGTGIGVIATPLLTLTIPVTDAVALLLPLMIVSDFFSLYYYRLTFDRRSVRLLIPGAVLGIVAGALFFDEFGGRQRVLQAAIGCLAIFFVAFQALRPFFLGALEKRRPSGAEGVAMGAAAGFFSTLAHAGGPPLVIYLLPQRMPKEVFVGTTVIFFAVINLLKLVPYQALGLFKMTHLTTILVLAPLAYVGVRLGVFMNRRFTDLWFNRVVYTILFLTGLQLVIGRNLLNLVWS
jgi:uncharacterized protein